MIERQVYSPVIERNGNGNGFHKKIEYSPVLEHEKKKNFIEIVLKRSGKKLEELPPEVAKTIIIVDSIIDLKTEKQIPLSDKFRLAGYSFWEVDGKFDLVKTYLGEDVGPKWESILNHVWEREDLISKSDRVKRHRIFLDEMLSKNYSNHTGAEILEMYRGQIQYLRGQGKSYRQILEEREQILRKTNRFLKADLHEKIAMKRRENKTVKQISYELMINEQRLERIISALIYIGKIKPTGGRKKESGEFSKICREIEKISREHPQWQYPEIASRLNISSAQVRIARMVLIEAKRIESSRNKKYLYRKVEIVEEEEKIKQLRATNPKMSYKQMARKIGTSVSRVQYFIERGIEKKEVKSWASARREELRMKLRAEIRKHMELKPNEEFYVTHFKKKVHASWSVISEIFAELESEFPGIKRAMSGFRYANIVRLRKISEQKRILKS